MPENQEIPVDPSEATVQVSHEDKPEVTAESQTTNGTQGTEAAKGGEEAKENGTQTEPKETAVKVEATNTPEEETNREIDRRVQQGVAKAKDDLSQVTALLANNPEKLQELKESNPDLYERLEIQVPDLKGSLTPKTENDKSELAAMVTDLLDANDEASMTSWADDRGIGEADYTARKALLKSKAKVLMKEKLVPSWEDALNVAGGIVFPSTKTKIVDNTKLEKLGNQGAKSVNRVPSNDDGVSDIDKASMKITGVSQEEHEQYTSDDIALPM